MGWSTFILMMAAFVIVAVACTDSAPSAPPSPPATAAGQASPLPSVAASAAAPTATATPSAAVAASPASPVMSREPLSCVPDTDTLRPGVGRSGSWTLAGPVRAEGTIAQKNECMTGRATDSSVTFTVTASGIRTDFAYLASDGNDLDRWVSRAPWAPQLATDGNPVLTPDWDCQKIAWLTGGVPSFSYYQRDYGVGGRTLSNGTAIVLFTLSTHFQSHSEDGFERFSEYVYGYEKDTGRMVMWEESERGTNFGDPYTLNETRALVSPQMAVAHPPGPTPTASGLASVPSPTTASTAEPGPIPAVVTPKPTATPAGIVPTETPRPTPAPGVLASPPTSVAHGCDEYMGLMVSAHEAPVRATVTSYRCGGLHVDSTGSSPAVAPSLAVPRDLAVNLRLTAGEQPLSVEVRLYPGAGVYGSFLRWPEDLSSGAEPVDAFEPAASSYHGFQFLPMAPPGDYSLVVRAAWEGAVEALFAISLRLE